MMFSRLQVPVLNTCLHIGLLVASSSWENPLLRLVGTGFDFHLPVLANPEITPTEGGAKTMSMNMPAAE